MKKNDLLRAVKQAILQQAIQGKLTAGWREQNPNTEPASKLLKRIKAEKEKLIKEKKIRKEKPLPPITKEEIPFELPKVWVWCRLGEITNYGSSEKIEPNKISPNTWVLDLEDIEKDSSIILRKVLFKERPSTSTKSVFKKNWVLYSKLRPYLDKVVIPDENGVCTTEILPLPIFGDIVPHFLMFSMKSKDFLDYVNSKVSGMKMPRLRTDDGKNALIPLPPLAEQKAIVEKVESLMQQCDMVAKGESIENLPIIHPQARKLIELYDKINITINEIQTQKQLVTQLKQSILQEAIQGKLTSEWRAQNSPNSPPLEGWQTKSDGVVNSPFTEEWQTKSDGAVKGTSTKIPSRNSKNYFRLPYNPKLKQRAKELRKAGNLSEVLFWNQVKNKKFLGLDFDRQKIIGNYIVDFYCPNNQVVIEIDGSSHDDKQDYDAKRDQYLKSLGLTVIHIPDIDVKRNLNGVMVMLYNHPIFNDDIIMREQENHPVRLKTDTPPKEGNWEPASELLKRIKVEKEKLIKEKKIRKEKPLPPITQEEIPFELPEGWVWCRLGEIIELIMGQSPSGHTYNKVGNGLPFFQGKKEFGAIYPNGNSTWCSEPKRISKANDILISVRAPVGDVNLSDKEYAIGRGLSIIRVFSEKHLYYWFLFYLLRAEQNNWKGKGSFFSAINRNLIENKIIPLPPLAEQKAIVEKVETLMQKVSAMEEEIKQSDQNAQMLMQAVLKEAFEGKKEEVGV